MSKNNRLFGYIIIAVIILLFDYFGLLNFIKQPADKVIAPIEKRIFDYTKRVRNFGDIFFLYPQISKVWEENQTLKKTAEELKLKVRQLRDENTKIRIQLEAPFPPSFKFVPAQVIALSRFLELNAGSDDGVKKGQIVVDGEVLVGKIEKTTPGRSTVLLVSDPDFKIAAVSSRGAKGEVAGQSGQIILLTKVLQKDPLFIDDQVITSGEEFTPPNLLIGKISHVTVEETAAYKQAKVEPLVDFGKLSTVFIITSL